MERSNYRYYENEQLEISSIDSRLNDDERKIRRFLMNFLIDNHKPFYIKKLDKLAISLNMNVELVESIIGHLIENNTIVTDEYDNINFIYPVSALETNHNVELADGRTFHAMCAIDAIGAAFTFKQDVTISSKCSNTGEDVNVVIENGQLTSYKPTDLHILHVDLNKNLNWSGNCWNIMNFFCTEKDYNQWVDSMDLDRSQIFCLNANEAIIVSKMLFSVTDI